MQANPRIEFCQTLKARTPSPRTAIYARVSTLDQDPAMQLRELRAYAKHRRLPIADEFIDQVSGARVRA